MKIGVNRWVWTSPFSTKDFYLIPKVRQMGFDVLEVALEDASIIDAELLRKMTEDNGLSVTVCGAFGQTRDVSSEDLTIRKSGADYMRKNSDSRRRWAPACFAGTVYSAVGKTRLVPDEQKKREWAWCVENLREVGKAATDAGVTIGVEPLNRFETDMINLVEQAVTLVRDVDSPAYKIHIDTFHANIEEKSIPDAIRKLGKGMLCHFHACENDRGIPGTGHQDWMGIRDALRGIEYDGAAVIESFTPGTVEIAKAASIWRPLAPTQDELAAQGATFLRRLLG